MKRIVLCVLIILSILCECYDALAFDQTAVEMLIRTKRCVGCNLYRANLNELDLRNANLKNANLGYATFRKATLYGADLTGADIRGTDFSGALWIDGSICQPGSYGRCIKASGNQ